ncbi:MAG: hypothetical protein M3534_16470 [Actinomycetota bacterium]|nr:hypothetical protein [Actinomycetota bacterium]
MDARGRIMAGMLGGAGTTLILSGLREAWKRAGLVFDTAPTQVVDRVEEVFAADGFSPGTRRALAAVAHVAYGVGTGGPSASCAGRAGARARRPPLAPHWGYSPGARGGPAGCRSPASTERPGPSVRPRSCFLCWTTPSTARPGA